MNFMKSLILDLDIVTGETVTRQNFDMGIFFMLTNKICINESFSLLENTGIYINRNILQENKNEEHKE